MRLPLLLILVGAVLAGVGAGLLLAYPSLILKAVSVEDFRAQQNHGDQNAFEDYDKGDTIYFKDTIGGVSYDSAEKVTVVRIDGGKPELTTDDMEFRFKGDIGDDFGKGDKVIIKDEVISKDGNETRKGFEQTLEVEAIEYLYGSTTELAFGGLALAGVALIIVGAVLHLRGGDEAEAEAEAGQGYGLIAPSPQAPPHLAQQPPPPQPAAPQPAAAPPVTVACPTCQQHLQIVDPTRPLTVACPHCTSPLMVQ